VSYILKIAHAEDLGACGKQSEPKGLQKRRFVENIPDVGTVNSNELAMSTPVSTRCLFACQYASRYVAYRPDAVTRISSFLTRMPIPGASSPASISFRSDVSVGCRGTE
jgi:hypothetical protein